MAKEQGIVAVTPIEKVTFSHLGFAVRDIDEFQRTWGTLLGVSDWFITEAAAPAGFAQLRGQPAGPVSSRVAFAKFGGVSFELIEPLQGTTHAAEHVHIHHQAVHHVAFWVPDLPEVIGSLDADTFEVVYSAESLRQPLAGRPVSAEITGVDIGQFTAAAPTPPPFYAYLETVWNREWSLELLDSRFAADYRQRYGDTVYYPDDFAPDDGPDGRPSPPGHGGR